MTKNALTQLAKNTLRSLGLIIIKPRDNELTKKIKGNFTHNERSFIYKHLKLMVDCIYCHAAPGVIEMTLTELTTLQPNRQGKKLLNLGGGTGQVAKILESLGYDVYNIDIDTKPEEVSEKNINFDLNSTQAIPMNIKFDVVLCQEIIEHLENPWKLFRDAKNILTNDGLFIVSTPNIASSFSKLKFYFTDHFKWFSPDCFEYHVNPLPYWEIKLIGERTGFELIKIKGSGDFFFKRDETNNKKIIKDNEELIFIFKIKK